MVIEFSNCSSATGEKCTSPFENEKSYTLFGKYGMLIENFQYFQAMANPYVGVTVKVDITDFRKMCAQKGYSFFLSFVYCVGRAANAVPEIRQRIVDGTPVEYDRCDTSHTVLLENGTYVYCRLNCMQEFYGSKGAGNHAGIDFGKSCTGGRVSPCAVLCSVE